MDIPKRSDAICIVTDSSCDLPQRLVDRFRIAVVPLVVSFGAESYLDEDISPDTFWAKAAEIGNPQTSQPSPGAFEEVFEALVERGKQVLCITLTGHHSGTAATARLAARRFGDAVRLFDSQSLSLGLGFQVLEAAGAAEAGWSIEEIIAWLEDARSRVRSIVVLDTLESLRRGGRADGFIGVLDRVTRVLNIKPIVGFVDGRLQLLGMARSIGRALERAMAMAEESVGPSADLPEPLEHLGIGHIRSSVKAEELADLLADRFAFPREQILVREAGVVLASHAGVGAMGLFVMPRTARQPKTQ